MVDATNQDKYDLGPVKTDEESWYAVGRGYGPCTVLEDIMIELGVNSYGRIDIDEMSHDVGHEVHEDDLNWLHVDDDNRTLHVLDPNTGETLALFRPYSYDWDDEDDEDKPIEANMEIPSIGFKLEWYKYAFRGAYCNIEPTMKLVKVIRDICQPALDAAYRFTLHPHEQSGEINWVHSTGIVSDGGAYDGESYEQWTADITGGDWDHGIIKMLTDGNMDPELSHYAKGMYGVELRSSTDSHVFTVSQFDTLDDAMEFARLRARVFKPAGILDADR